MIVTVSSEPPAHIWKTTKNGPRAAPGGTTEERIARRQGRVSRCCVSCQCVNCSRCNGFVVSLASESSLTSPTQSHRAHFGSLGSSAIILDLFAPLVLFFATLTRQCAFTVQGMRVVAATLSRVDLRGSAPWTPNAGSMQPLQVSHLSALRPVG